MHPNIYTKYLRILHHNYFKLSSLESTEESISLYFCPFALSSSTTDFGAFDTNFSLDSLLLTLWISDSSLDFSLSSLWSSFLRSMSSKRGMNISAPFVTADTALGGTWDFEAIKSTSLAEASFIK